MKRHASKIAEAGYRVLVPDIYKGSIAVDKEEASHKMDASFDEIEYIFAVHIPIIVKSEAGNL